MPNLNKVLLMGHLTRDPEMKFTPGGTGLARIGVAVSRKFKDKKSNEMREEVAFVDVDAWGKTAEFVNQYFKKGSAIFIEGRLKLDQWDDKTTGAKRSKLFVVADNVQFAGSKPDGKPAAKAASVAAGTPADDDLEIPEETIPF